MKAGFLVQSFNEVLNVIPGDGFHRQVGSFEMGRVIPHDGLPLRLGDFIFPHVKTMGDGDSVTGAFV